MNLTLDQLRVLQAVHRTGSITAAAARLRRAQSAVSYALKNLEHGLALSLVDHASYRAGLTEAGRAILAQAERVLSGVAELEQAAAELAGAGAEPHLRVLVDGILPVTRLIGRLTPFVARDTPTRLTLRVGLLGGLADALEREHPEIVLAPRGTVPLAEGYEEEPVGELLMVPVVSPAHPLAGLAAPVSLARLREHVHLVVTSPPGRPTPVSSGLIGAERQWNFPDFHTRLEGLRAGLGFAWMPTWLVEAELRAGTLAPLVLDRANVHRSEVGLFHRRQPPLGPTGREVLARLREPPALLPGPPADLLRPYGLP